jgi:4,4'-diaponeurosporenoate glycosyltransferase
VNIVTVHDAAVVAFGTGWLVGWLLLWRPRPLPPADSPPARRGVAVVVPARDEAHALGTLVPPLLAAARAGDEVVVVDDHSSDATSAVAAALGARVVGAPRLPEGWLGKPHACWQGAAATTAPILLFVDADVRPPADLLDRIASACERHPGSVVSVQPWHDTGSLTEQASVLCNTVALMGAGRFTVAGARVGSAVAFGPVLAVERSTYDRVGGHGAPSVRRAHTEDIALARTVGRADVYTGRPDIRFRMYPGGLRETVRGWSRSIATGAAASPWWAGIATAAWVWSLAGGVFATLWAYPLCAAQVWVLGRRAARTSPWLALAYPVAVAVLAAVFVRSVVLVVTRRDVTLKGRAVASR